METFKVYVKSFPGLKVSCLVDYVQSALTEMPTHIILYVGTNYVPTKIDHVKIADDIVNLAIKLRKELCCLNIRHHSKQ